MSKGRSPGRLGNVAHGDVWTVEVIPLSGEPFSRTLRLSSEETQRLLGNLSHLYSLGVLRDYQVNRYVSGSLENFMEALGAHLQEGWRP